MKKTISVSQYNALFHIAENILQQSWRDLGLTEEEITERSNKNPKLKLANSSGLEPVYYLYKKNANELVDKILQELSIDTSDKSLGCRHENTAPPSHKALKGGYASKVCADCGTDFGWFCENSPDKGCHYFTEDNKGKRVVRLATNELIVVESDPSIETSDCCLFCHNPDERK